MYEELIKRLRNVSMEYGQLDHFNNVLLREAADTIEDLENKLNLWRQDKISRWVPVTERLPGGRDSVLALTGDCDIYVCDYIPSVKQFWTIPGDELHIDDITHWMPLPEPPKEET